MTNFEYYAKNDAENFSNYLSMSSGLAVRLSNNKEVLADCHGTPCSDCLFGSRTFGECQEGRRQWLFAEHKGDAETPSNEGGISW